MAQAVSLAVFDTVLGPCAVAWNAHALAGVQLPDGDAAATRARMQRRFPLARPAPPPDRVAGAIERIQRALAGHADDLCDIALDMSGVPPFHQRVYAVARSIAPGNTLTYGQVAARLGMPGAARAVGQALGHNPFAPVVPCHRVLAAGGRAGGFSANGGAVTKLKMLEAEGAQFGAGPGLFDAPAR